MRKVRKKRYWKGKGGKSNKTIAEENGGKSNCGSFSK